MMETMRSFLVTMLVLLSALPLAAQSAMPAANATPFRDTSSFKPPAGVKVAIVEFEDLECFACSQAAPIVTAAIRQYKVPRVHHDCLIQSHVWSRTAAINARYLEDKVSLQKAEEFRRDVFVNQQIIASQEDLQLFTRKWFQTHGQQMPFVVDPSGRCAAEVESDCALAVRVGVRRTPTILVVTEKQWIEVSDPKQLYAALDRAEASLRN